MNDLTGVFAVRPYTRDDEGFVLEFWLKSYAWDTKAGSRADMADHKRYWAVHRRNVLGLLARQQTLVACDSEEPRNCLAFACMGDGVVHYFHVKGGMPSWTKDFAEALLGDRLRTRQFVTYQIPALRPMPYQWVLDPHCIHSILEGP